MIRDDLLSTLKSKDGPFAVAVARTIEEVAMRDREYLADVWRSFGGTILRKIELEDRRRVVARDLRSALRAVIPVGNSGARKQINDLTKVDILRIANLHALAARTRIEHEKVLRHLAERVGDGTVGEVWRDITIAERKEILRAFGTRLAEAKEIAA